MRGVTTYSQETARLAVASGYQLGLVPGTERYVTKIEGWHSGAKMRRNSTARMQQHGNFTEPGYRDARYPSISGHYVAPSRRAAQEFIDEINAYLGDGTEGILEVTDADQGTRWATVLLIGTDVKWNGDRDVSFTVDMEAPDARKYGQTTTESTGVARESGGLVFDIFGGAPLVERRRNLAPNPTAGVDAGGYTLADVTAARVTTAAAVDPAVGSGFQLSKATTALDSYMSYGSPGSRIPGFTDGRTYTASATFYQAGAQAGAIDGRGRRIVVYSNVAGAGYVSIQSEQAPNVAGRARVSVTFTVPAGATELFVRFYHGAAAGSVTWSALLLEEAATAGTYFDGSAVAPAGYVNAWTGTPNASASIQQEQTGYEGVLDFGPAGSLGTITLRNEGRASVYPVLEVAGPTPSFTITELETGRRLIYQGLVQAGQLLTMNGADGSVKLDGYADRLVNLVRAEWPEIPGQASRTYLLESTNGPDARLTGKVAPAWW